MITFRAAEGIDMPPIDTDRLGRWIGAVAAAHGRRVGELAYLFVGEDEMLAANRHYLGHDYHTDIITFDYTERNIISGDILVSPSTVRSNAALLSASCQEELCRVLIHGVLHLCGIGDKGDGEREHMEAEENAALAMLIDK